MDVYKFCREEDCRLMSIDTYGEWSVEYKIGEDITLKCNSGAFAYESLYEAINSCGLGTAKSFM